MAIPASFEPVIALLAERLRDRPKIWALTGSLGMALQGMDLEVHDIDLQLDSDGVYTIQDELLEYVSQPIYWRESERIRSHFGKLEIDGVEIDIMDGIEKRLVTGAWAPPVDMRPLMVWVNYHSLRLPVLDLDYEYEAYRLMGREAKAEKIRQFLQARKQQETYQKR